MIRNKTGVWGELFAVRYLRDKGYKIMTSNYVCRFGEIDIVAMKNNVLCFVEVKTRNKDTDLRPMEAVDAGKRNRLEMAAKSFMSRTGIMCSTRFDVCEVYVDDDDKLFELNYIENAF